MKTNLKNSILAGIAFAILVAPVLVVLYKLTIAIIIAPLAGLVFAAMMHSFMNSKMIQGQTSVDSGQADVIYSGGANHFKNSESVGGKLYLFADRLFFKSHKFNVQNHELEIPLKEIEEVSFCRSLGIVPNGLLIKASSGKAENFVVNNRSTWKDKINEAQNNNISL